MTEAADIERVTREIHILRRIRHPHLVQLYDIIETKKQLFLITEYAAKGELFDYIVSKQRLEEEEACKFFQEILSGVEYVHRLNIVHRDLKPENLLLDYKNSIKIIDFGLSNTYKEGETLKTACGSPCYAAPEMIAGKKYNGLLVDIWSCGIILYAMLCGYLPFEDPDTTELYKKILKGDFDLPDFLSSNAKDILKKIMNTDPETRYKIKDIMNHPWYSLARAEKNDEGIMIGYQPVPIDPLIITEMSKYNIDPEYARKCLEANRHNEITTTYYLLIKKHQKDGKRDIIDPNSSLCLKKNELNKKEEVDEVKMNGIESLNLESSLALYDIENRYSDYVIDKAEYKTSYKSKSINGSYRKQPRKFDQLFTNLRIPKNSKQYGMTSKLPQKVVNRSHYLEVVKDSKQSSFNESMAAERSDLSFGVFADNDNSNERLQKVYEVYKKVANQTKTHQRLIPNTIKLSSGPRMKVPKPPVDPRIPQSKRQNRFIAKNFSPYISVRPTTKSQNKKKAINISIKKATSHVEGRTKKIPLKNENKVTPITIIQAPLINTYNNYNNFNIGNFSLGHIQESGTMTKPAVPNFRKRKYLGNNKDKPNTPFV